MIAINNMYTKKALMAATQRPITANRQVQQLVPGLGVSGQTTYIQTDDGGSSNGLQKSPNTSYIELQIANTTAVQQIVPILDPSGGYFLFTGRGIPAGVTITGLTTQYQIWLNAMASGIGYQITMARINVTLGDNAQIGIPIDLFDVGPSSPSESKLQTIFPNRAFNEYQQLANVQTFPEPAVVTNLRALVQRVQPNTTFSLAFDIVAEMNRTI